MAARLPGNQVKWKLKLNLEDAGGQELNLPQNTVAKIFVYSDMV